MYSCTGSPYEHNVTLAILKTVLGLIIPLYARYFISFHYIFSQEQVCELYQQLHHAEVPAVLAQFESVLVSIIRDIRQHQAENERLERSYKR